MPGNCFRGGFHRDQYAAEEAAQQALWGVHNLQIILAHGFTTLRDACEDDPAYGQFALRNSIDTGLIRGPRIVSAGGCISVTGGHGNGDPLAPDRALPRRPNLADDVDQISSAVRRDIKYGADWIKLMATGGVKKVMAHAEGTDGIKAAVRAGVDSVEHGAMLDEEGAALMQQKGTWLVPTLYTFQHSVEKGDHRVLTRSWSKRGRRSSATSKTHLSLR